MVGVCVPYRGQLFSGHPTRDVDSQVNMLVAGETTPETLFDEKKM